MQLHINGAPSRRHVAFVLGLASCFAAGIGSASAQELPTDEPWTSSGHGLSSVLSSANVYIESRDGSSAGAWLEVPGNPRKLVGPQTIITGLDVPSAYMEFDDLFRTSAVCRMPGHVPVGLELKSEDMVQRMWTGHVTLAPIRTAGTIDPAIESAEHPGYAGGYFAYPWMSSSLGANATSTVGVWVKQSALPAPVEVRLGLAVGGDEITTIGRPNAYSPVLAQVTVELYDLAGQLLDTEDLGRDAVRLLVPYRVSEWATLMSEVDCDVLRMDESTGVLGEAPWATATCTPSGIELLLPGLSTWSIGPSNEGFACSAINCHTGQPEDFDFSGGPPEALWPPASDSDFAGIAAWVADNSGVVETKVKRSELYSLLFTCGKILTGHEHTTSTVVSYYVSASFEQEIAALGSLSTKGLAKLVARAKAELSAKAKLGLEGGMASETEEVSHSEVKEGQFLGEDYQCARGTYFKCDYSKEIYVCLGDLPILVGSESLGKGEGIRDAEEMDGCPSPCDIHDPKDLPGRETQDSGGEVCQAE